MLATCVCAGATGAAGFSAGRGGTIGAVGFAAAGGAAGLLIGAAAGLLIAAGASGAVCLLMAFSTSPGLEIFERSILGLISAAAGALRFSAALASAALAKCLRTLSASSCSSELEWLFFSVTPMLGMWSTLKGMLAMMLGGLGSLPGAVAGGLALGLLEAHGQWYLGPQLRDFLAYFVLFALLALRAPWMNTRSAS